MELFDLCMWTLTFSSPFLIIMGWQMLKRVEWLRSGLLVRCFERPFSPCGEFMHVSLQKIYSAMQRISYMGGQRSCWIHSPLSILTAYACLEPLHHTPTFCPTAILSLTWPTTVSYRTKTGHTLKKDLISWTRIWCGSKDDMGVWKEREREKGTKNWSECGTWKQLLGQ